MSLQIGRMRFAFGWSYYMATRFRSSGTLASVASGVSLSASHRECYLLHHRDSMYTQTLSVWLALAVRLCFDVHLRKRYVPSNECAADDYRKTPLMAAKPLIQIYPVEREMLSRDRDSDNEDDEFEDSLSDDDFDYEEFVAQEFEGRNRLKPIWIFTAWIVLIAIIVPLLLAILRSL